VVRRLFTFACVVSLLLCAAFAVLWIAGYWRDLELSYNRPGPPTYAVTGFWLSVGFQRGDFTVEYPHMVVLGIPCWLPVFWFSILPTIAGIGMARRRQQQKQARGFPIGSPDSEVPR